MALDKEQPATLTSLQPIVITSYTNYPLLLHKLLFKPLNANHHKHILRNPTVVSDCSLFIALLRDAWQILFCSGHSCQAGFPLLRHQRELTNDVSFFSIWWGNGSSVRGIDFISFWLDKLSHFDTKCYSNRSIERAAKNRCGKGKVHLSYAKLSPH